jgi:hypothetical protein
MRSLTFVQAQYFLVVLGEGQLGSDPRSAAKVGFSETSFI